MGTIVSRVIKKSREIYEEKESLLATREDILSGNLVTGYSVNFPIFQTCQPTKVCIDTCYYAKGMTAFRSSLKKQIRLYRTTREHPEYVAFTLAKAYKELGMDFLRWNGGGDLFKESVEALNLLIDKVPGIVVWRPSRRLDFAALIHYSPTVFVNISLDRSSMEKLDRYTEMTKASQNYFFSYQYDKDERTDPSEVDHRVSLIYLHGDREPTWLQGQREERICPRTFTNDKENTCSICRRCFNGENATWRLDHAT